MTITWQFQDCLSFFDQKLQFTHVQATGEAFSFKKTSNTLKNEILEPDTNTGTQLKPDPIRIRIHNIDFKVKNFFSHLFAKSSFG
jgi:hypothetical protein